MHHFNFLSLTDNATVQLRKTSVAAAAHLKEKSSVVCCITNAGLHATLYQLEMPDKINNSRNGNWNTIHGDGVIGIAPPARSIRSRQKLPRICGGRRCWRRASPASSCCGSRPTRSNSRFTTASSHSPLSSACPSSPFSTRATPSTASESHICDDQYFVVNIRLAVKRNAARARRANHADLLILQFSYLDGWR